jgi:UDP-glucose 4-epimerase
MKVAIVGSTGFIGSHLTRNWSIGKDEMFFFNSRNIFSDRSNKLNYDFLKCDLIVWAAGRVNPSLAEHGNLEIEQELANWDIVMNSFSAIKCSTDKRFVFVSSGGCTYTSTELPYKESDQALGTNRYGKMKLRQEHLLSECFTNNAIIRLSNVYGPGQSIGKGQGVIAEWVSAIGKGETLKMYGRQESFRDYLHILDAASAIEIIAKDEIQGVVNVGSGEPTTLEDLKRHFLNLSGLDIKFYHLSDRIIDRSGYYLSIQKLMSVTGWRPTISISEGINKMLNPGLG